MDEVECGYLRCISGWFEASREPLGSRMVHLGCQNTDWLGGNNKQVSDAIPRQYGLILLPETTTHQHFSFIGYRAKPRPENGLLLIHVESCGS